MNNSLSPLSINDIELGDIEDLTSPKCIEILHNIACEKEYNTYIDPSTGYKVMTSYYLKKNKCCGNKCRHCPWGYINVKNK